MREKILEYFKEYRLIPLDHFFKKYYTGVTLPYIYKCVLKEEYPIEEVKDLLIELHDEDEIKSLYCHTVKDVVFESNLSQHRNYNKNKTYLPYDGLNMSYDYFLNRLNEIVENEKELSN